MTPAPTINHMNVGFFFLVFGNICVARPFGRIWWPGDCLAAALHVYAYSEKLACKGLNEGHIIIWISVRIKPSFSHRQCCHRDRDTQVDPPPPLHTAGQNPGIRQSDIRPAAQIPQCTSHISHNAPFCNRNVHMCAHFCHRMMHCGIFDALWVLWDALVSHKNVFCH